MTASNPRKPALSIIALALHLSIPLYVFAIFFMANTQGWAFGWDVKPELTPLLLIFVCLSLTTTVFAALIPRLKGFNKTPSASTPGPSLAGKNPLFLDFNHVTPEIHGQTIIRLALAESIALFGFVAAFINQAPLLILPFAVYALTLQILFGPFAAFGKRKAGHPHSSQTP